jgi:squalene-hopene/tetraprenyl-beta-curcumene cyclase
VKTLLRFGCLLAAAVVVAAGPTRPAPAADAVGPNEQDARAVLDKAVAYLKKHQNDDGSFAPKLGGPGVTALITAGLIHNGYGNDDPVVAKSIGYLEKSVKKDGGIYDKRLANYTTSVALLAFVEANKNGKYDTIIKNASKFLKTLQDDALKEDDVRFGGVSYDGKERPDLSNTAFFVEAMLAAGISKDDPAIKNALKFASRCQNLPGETNDQPFAKKTTDDDRGGFVYNPIVNDENKARTKEGGLRSAGVMTYAGLKTFLYAGVDRNDPRVKAAVDWCARHYTLEESPGQGQAGLYYYYHTFGKAMQALGQDQFKDKDGKMHDWRKDLFEALKKRQKDDGSWANENSAFFENTPELATAYAILAMSYTKAPKK